MMLEAGLAWSNFAMSLKKASEENRPDFTESIDKLTGLVEKKKSYHKAALKLG